MTRTLDVAVVDIKMKLEDMTSFKTVKITNIGDIIMEHMNITHA